MLGTATPPVREPLAAPMRVDLALPLDLRLVSDSPPAVSPDGRYLAFAASHEGRRRVYLRDLETGDLRPLAGTENGMVPFWSPDGSSVAFFANGQLKRVPRSGGTPLAVAPAGTAPVGGDWSRDDVVVSTPYLDGAIWRVPAAGGTPPGRGPSGSFGRGSGPDLAALPARRPDTAAAVRDSGRSDRDALMMRSLDRDDATVIAGVAT